MMKAFTLPLALLWFLAILVANIHAEEPTRVTPQWLKTTIEKGEPITLIDVRTHKEYNKGHIQGAIINIPLKGFSTLKEFPYQGKVVLYCTTGVRSSKAKKFLEGKGIRGVVDLEGGIKAWEKVGGKVVTPSKLLIESVRGKPSSWHRDDDPPIVSGYPKSFQVPKGVCEQGLGPSLVISR